MANGETRDRHCKGTFNSVYILAKHTRQSQRLNYAAKYLLSEMYKILTKRREREKEMMEN